MKFNLIKTLPTGKKISIMTEILYYARLFFFKWNIEIEFFFLSFIFNIMLM